MNLWRFLLLAPALLWGSWHTVFACLIVIALWELRSRAG